MNWVSEAFDTLYSQPSWYLGSAMTSCYILYYLFEVVKKPLIATSPKGKFAEFINKCMPVLKEKFWPTLWCIESRAQTVIATFVRVSTLPRISYKREILTLKDGGEICLDTLDPFEGCSASTPTIIVLPGLTGGSKSDYVTGIALTAKDAGIRTLVFNQRGIGGILIKTPRTYCAANCEDLVEVIEYARKKYEGAKLAAVGISMGGLILGNYLSSPEAARGPLKCAMIISVPWNVHLGAQSIETPILNLMLNRHLANCLCDIVRRMRGVLENSTFISSNEIEECLKSRTIREFDRHFTVKQFGFRDVDDYYDKASLHDKITNIPDHIPVLCLSAADDPFQPVGGIPIDAACAKDNLCIIVTSRGGHIGFMEGICPISRQQYMFRIFEQFFRSTLVEDGLTYFT